MTYSGPHFINFGQKRNADYTLEYFQRCLFSKEPIHILSSDFFVDELWATKQDDVTLLPNPGWHVLQEGAADGMVMGGNLGTLHLLQGTDYMPQMSQDIILCIEDDAEDHPAVFDRNLQSLLHQKFASKIRGVVIGRCQRESGITFALLQKIIASKKELKGIPVLAGLDFGHTTPMFTFPLGGKMELVSSKTASSVTITTQ